MYSYSNLLFATGMEDQTKSCGFKYIVLASVLAILGLFLGENVAQAQNTITASITADNYFKLCHGTPGGAGWLTCTAAYDDWKTAHTLSITPNPSDYVYIVAWSDDNVAQGVLADLSPVNPGASLQWEVHPTSDNRDSVAQEPTTTQIESNVTGPWYPVTLSTNLPNGGSPFTNGSSPLPWVPVTGISPSTPWMWYDSGTDPTSQAPLIPGGDHGEYLIFRIPAKDILCEICGVKFHDLNGNSIWDSNEPTLSNWPIVLVDQNGNAQMTTTSSTGHFAFAGLASGTYTVYEVAQPGWSQTAPSTGAYTVNFVQGQPTDPLHFGNKLCEKFDLAIVKSTNSTFQVGQNVTYDISVSHSGNAVVAGPIVVADTLPMGLTPSTVTPADPNWTCQITGQTVTCIHPGILPLNYSTNFTINALVGPPAVPSVQNCANITASGDVNSTNDQYCVQNDVPKPQKPKADLGDAPDSTNHLPTGMTTYFGSVAANFPTVYDGDPIPGPIHWQPKGLAWLGNDVSDEQDADLLPDGDGVTNIEPPTNIADRDGYDDGIQLKTLELLECTKTQFAYDVTAVNSADMFVNVWFDFNRDGDWNDILRCKSKDEIFEVHEWAVRDQIIGFGPGSSTHWTPSFVSMNIPHEDNPMWMRITLRNEDKIKSES